MIAMVDERLDAIASLCREYDVQELSVFGSAVRDDFGPGSDIDFLVVFRGDDYGPFLCKLMDLESGLSDILGRCVEVVTRPSVEASDNYLRRDHILSSLETVYVAR